MNLSSRLTLEHVAQTSHVIKSLAAEMLFGDSSYQFNGAGGTVSYEQDVFAHLTPYGIKDIGIRLGFDRAVRRKPST